MTELALWAVAYDIKIQHWKWHGSNNSVIIRQFWELCVAWLIIWRALFYKCESPSGDLHPEQGKTEIHLNEVQRYIDTTDDTYVADIRQRLTSATVAIPNLKKVRNGRWISLENKFKRYKSRLYHVTAAKSEHGCRNGEEDRYLSWNSSRECLEAITSNRKQNEFVFNVVSAEVKHQFFKGVWKEDIEG